MSVDPRSAWTKEQAVSDIGEIQSLIVRQKILADARDLDGLTACYAAEMRLSTSFDGADPVVVDGRENVLERMRTGWSTPPEELPFEPHIHFVGPADVTILPDDRASARSMCIYLSLSSGRIVGWGHYQDRLVRGADGWCFTERTMQATFV
jgi:hypothetical protein